MSIELSNTFSELTRNTPGYKLRYMKTSLADRLTQAMTARDISQGALAKASGVAQPTIWRLVNGQAKGSTKLVDIANALKVNIDWLANGVGEMDSDDRVTYPHPPAFEMQPGGVIPVPVWEEHRETDTAVYVPEAVSSQFLRAYILSRNSGCAEAPAGSIVVIDTMESPGNDDLVYAKVNSSFSVYRFLEGGDAGFLAVDDPRVPLINAASSEIIGVAVFLLRDLKRRK